MEATEINTFNKFFVSAAGSDLALLKPPGSMQRLTKDDALNLAAWLVAIVGDRERFLAVLEAVENT